MYKMPPVRGVLSDLDGTVYQQGRIISGVQEALAELERMGIPVRFITNTTRKSRRNILKSLEELGLKVDPQQIFAASHAALEYCRKAKYRHIRLVTAAHDLKEDFAEFELDSPNPEAVVLGDLNTGFNFSILNEIFRLIGTGATLVAMQKNRYWLAEDGLTLDMGPFVAALEYASGKEAVVVGKPDPAFFKLAISGWNIPPENILVIGDDIKSDVSGARNSGMNSALVRTGKFKPDDLNDTSINPDAVLSSFSQLPGFIKKINKKQE